jgi:uncharacterized protein YecE (DUF72 family)
VIRVGPAGWSYADWGGRVYPRPKPPGFHGLAYLARFVQVVEVNSTFYAPPRAEVTRRWVQRLAPYGHLLLTAKLERTFTHRPRADSRAQIEVAARVFLDGLEPLVAARRLAALLVQFPLSFHQGAAELRHLGLLRALFGELPLVLELRHRSWFEPDARRQIAGLGYSLAYIDLPAAHDHPPPWHAATGPIGYLRLHGRNAASWFSPDAGRDARYDYLYSRAELSEVAARARRIAGEHDQTFVVTNNHFEGKAVANALEIMAELRGALVDGPAELVRAYPRLERSVRAVDAPGGGQGELF